MVNKDARKMIFLLFIALVIICFTLATQKAKSQDELYTLEQDTYGQAFMLYQEDEFEDSLKLTTELIKRKPNTDLVNYLHALNLSNTNHFEQAKLYFEKTLEINPHFVEDSLFMLSFGEALQNGNYIDEAIIVFNRCATLEFEEELFPDFKEKVQQHLDQLNKAGGN